MASQEQVLGELEFRQIQQRMEQASGIHLTEQKRTLVGNRLQGRLRALGLDTYAQYLQRVSADAAEHQHMVDVLTTNETRFFREPRHFDLLREYLQASAPSRLRIWSGACSSGQEPYTLAMTLAESLPHRNWEIIASDLSRTVLQTAAAGVYPERAGQDIPRPLLVKYCRKGVQEMAGFFQICPALRQRVQFQAVNLMQPLPDSLGVFDVIFLRNVLIYFDTACKTLILRQALQRLRPGGLLFVGHSETLHGLGLPVSVVAPAVYRKGIDAATGGIHHARSA